MSAVLGSYTYEMDASYAADFSRDREPMKKRSRHPEYRRKGSAPTRVSGMHCRRNKRWTWGSGRGARMANLRTFAGCLALMVAAAGANALGAGLNLLPVGNPGNPGNPSASNRGAVASLFYMANTETTNSQYVAFLNAVDPNGANPNGIYTSAMGTSAAGGIVNTGTVPGARYSVKPGVSPSGVSYANMPVNNVTWFSAARYVNWIANGLQSGTGAAASMEIGSYTLGGITSGSAPARNGGAQYFLPSMNEWYKAAFYTGTGSTYNRYQTNTSVQPAATAVTGSANAANYNNVVAAPLTVGSYTNASTSFYGMYDMLGNVTEYTDTGASSTAVTFFGANFQNTTAAVASNWTSLSALRSTPTTGFSDATGFRIASTVAPVPEPETITLAAFGIVGLCGANWLKRRRKVAAHQVAEGDLLAA